MLKTKVIIAGASFVGCLWASCGAQEWQPATGPLATRWSKQVSVRNVLPEYPRPQLVRPSWTNLNGLWEYSLVDAHADQPDHWDGQILVPFAIESALSGVMKQVGPSKSLWYRRKWQEAQRGAKDRVLLHFGAIDWESQVWVNGRLVGEHRGGYDPFSFDITDALRNDTTDQELVIRVWDPSDSGSQPRGKQVEKPQGIFYTAVTGIWQTVWSEVVPAQYVSQVRMTPDVDRSQVSVRVVSRPMGVPVEITIRDGENEIARGQGKTGETTQIPIKNAKLWSPKQPHLYDVTIRLATGDEVKTYFGMRKIEMGKDAQGIQRMLLNGEPVFQLGPLDQGWWPDGLYTAPTDEALKYDIEITRAMGFNMARKHVKVEPERWYYWADKLGLLVWQDMPSLMARGQNQQVKPAQQDDISLTAQEARQYLSEWQSIIDANYNHPSIVVWVPFNEGWGQHETNRILKWTKQYDATRLIDGPSGWEDRGWGELKDMHMYPGPGMFPTLSDRISVLGEFGGLGFPMPGHLWQKDRNWGYRNLQTQAELSQRYRDLIARLHVLIGQGLSAAIYTQTTDVEGEVNGLLTYDREVIKMDPQQLAQLHATLASPAPIEVNLLATSEADEQIWRYTFQQPENGWESPNFNDASWSTGAGGFGTTNTPNTKVRTKWSSEDIWLRREFDVEQVNQGDSLWLRVFHDEDCEIYLNGVLAAKLSGFNSGYELITVSTTATAAVRTGKNVLAVHCHQSTGGQYIDAGLSRLKAAPRPQ